MYEIIKKGSRKILQYTDNNISSILLIAEEIEIIGTYQNKTYIKTSDKKGFRKMAYYIEQDNTVHLILCMVEKWGITYTINFIIPKEENSYVLVILKEINYDSIINYLYLENGKPIIATNGAIVECVTHNKTNCAFAKVFYKGCTEFYDLKTGTPLFMTDCDTKIFKYQNYLIIEILNKKQIKLIYYYSIYLKKFLLLFKPKTNSGINKSIVNDNICYTYETTQGNIKQFFLKC